MIAARVSITRGAAMGHNAQQEDDMEATNTDRIRPAPTALFRMAPYPEVPRVREVTGEVDLQALLIEELGGEPEQHLEPDESSLQIGVIDVYVRGEVKVHVHSHPDAFIGLQQVTLQFQRELTAEAISHLTGGRVLIISGPPGVCICGQCDMGGGGEVSPADDDDRLS